MTPRCSALNAEFAEGYGFRIAPCPPRDPQKKGLVESGVKYVKRSFLPLRTFRSLPDANRQALDWVMKEAGNRCHGTTREQASLTWRRHCWTSCQTCRRCWLYGPR